MGPNKKTDVIREPEWKLGEARIEKGVVGGVGKRDEADKLVHDNLKKEQFWGGTGDGPN